MSGGTFSDEIISMANQDESHKYVSVAQGTHVVLDRDKFPTEHAILIPETDDGRVLFILPWHDHLIVGTTDIKKEAPSLEPKAEKSEIDFILETFNEYALKQITINDIKSVYCGQRPLVSPKKQKNSSKISRKHQIIESKDGLITVVGGKWTIFRRMGQDVFDYLETGDIAQKTSKTSKNNKKYRKSRKTNTNKGSEKGCCIRKRSGNIQTTFHSTFLQRHFKFQRK